MDINSHDLVEFGKWYGTDKVVHTYLPIYAWYLGHLRDRTFTLLEIGVQYGRSLPMWRDYFPKAKIAGIDKDPECLIRPIPRAEPGAPVLGKAFPIFIGDQADVAFLCATIKKLGAPTVIIDDGSHNTNDQVISFETLFPFMEPGGFYFVEDVHWGWEEGGQPNFGKYAHLLTYDVNLHSKRVAQNCGNKWAQMGGDVGAMTDYEKTVRSVSYYKSLVVIEKEA
jgi:hypothetical protein